ncbi:MAG: formylglycine-generating enzyme family protein [Lewinellaceae bacterium]|nr:formylglycine-generating enzyme family protein [Lewinellaceae bacterium]
MAERDFKEVLPNGVSFEMMFVEGGAFRMGSKEKSVWREAPIHGVKLDSFYIGKFPVTQALWKAVMKDNPSFFNGDTRPVESVSWEDVQVFIKKLNEHTGKPYRLPTEAEWEYAARGGQQNWGCTFAGSDKLKEVGWYDENSHSETKAVGLKKPNELGLYDMSGNVFEWCQDWVSDDYHEQCHKQGVVENPQGPAKGSDRVLRGGSWLFNARDCRCPHRILVNPEFRGYDTGFRLVLPFQSVGQPSGFP